MIFKGLFMCLAVSFCCLMVGLLMGLHGLLVGCLVRILCMGYRMLAGCAGGQQDK